MKNCIRSYALKRRRLSGPRILSLRALVAILAVLPWGMSASADTLHVDYQAPGPAHDGTSWDTAYLTLQAALTAAVADDEIWIAEGTYKPTVQHGGTGLRYQSFQLKNGVAVYGGFDPDSRAVDMATRDWQNHVTMLSGDIGIVADSSDNCYHVFYHPYGLGLDATAVLDGVVIYRGNADGAGDPHTNGAGIYNDQCSPTLRNCTFIANTADDYGGGLCNKNYVTSAISNCRFTLNFARGGGAISSWNYSDIVVSDCQFQQNVAETDGGAMFNYMDSSPMVSNCWFIHNQATETTSDGGGIYNGWDCAAEVVNCLFVYNFAGNGGGMMNLSSDATVTHCSFYGNYAVNAGGGIYNYGSDPVVTNCILWSDRPGEIADDAGSVSVVDHCDITGGYAGGTNILSVNPQYQRVPDFWERTSGPGTTTTITVPTVVPYQIGDRIELGNDLVIRTVTYKKGSTITFSPALDYDSPQYLLVGNWGSKFVVSEVFYLTAASPCIDAGTNSAPAMPSIDFEHQVRPVDGDGNGSVLADLGMDEVHDDNIIYVDRDAGGLNTGRSWFHAYRDVQDALDDASSGDQIWIAAGTYYPRVEMIPGEPRTAAFQAKNGVAVYGGFDPGSGIDTFAERDGELYEATLSGDIGTLDDIYDNCYHVFYHPASSALDATAILDGLTIRHGNADTTINIPDSGFGGGMYNDQCAPTLVDCRFLDNNGAAGGALYTTNAAPSLTGCVFMGNNGTSGYGGAVYNDHAAPVLTGCIFGGEGFGQDNSAFLGGAMYNNASAPYLADCNFVRNNAQSGGGMFNDASDPNLTECYFYHNTAEGTWEYCSGGAMANTNGSAPELIDCTFHWNIAYGELWGKGGGIYGDTTSAATIRGGMFNHNVSWCHGGAFYLDGGSLTVTDTALMTGNHASHGSGGALYCTTSSYAAFTDCTFELNEADDAGGAVYGFDADAAFTRCSFTENEVTRDGGAVAWTDSTTGVFEDCNFVGNFTVASDTMGGAVYCARSTPLFERCLFNGNLTKIGGGMACWPNAAPSIRTCVFRDNIADNDAGAIFCHEYSSPTIVNTIFSGNQVTVGYPGYGSGGAMYIATDCAPHLINCTLWGNTAVSSGGGLYNFLSEPILTNCILWGNGSQIVGSAAVATYCDIQGGYGDPCDHNIDADPLFVDAAGGDLHLQADSPCIDTGSNATVPVWAVVDFEGDDRIIDGNGDGTLVVDIGADEAPPRTDEVWVDDDYSPAGANDGHTWGFDAFGLIQDGIDIVLAPGVVHVADGMYAEQITLRSGVQVLGAGPAGVTIDAGGTGSTVLASAVDATARLEGVTVTGGNAADGGGIRCIGSAVVIADCRIDGNHATWGGGMECGASSNPTLSACVFTNNTGDYGAALDIYNYSSPVLTDCTFGTNVATDTGGAVNIEANCAPQIFNAVIHDNAAHTGGAVYAVNTCSPLLVNALVTGNTAAAGAAMVFVQDCTASIINCTLFDNAATDPAPAGGALRQETNAVTIVTNSILWGNTPDDVANLTGGSATISYSDIQDGYPGTGNLSKDPYFLDRAHDNFRLHPDSYCIEAGSNAAVPPAALTDLDGRDRIVNGTCSPGNAVVDMGVYEHTHAYYGDFDGDCDTDLLDFAVLSSAWLSDPGDPDWHGPCDMNRDDTINPIDLTIFADHWLWGR